MIGGRAGAPAGPADSGHGRPPRAALSPGRVRLLLGAILLLAFALRWPGFTDPWSGKGFNTVIGSWTTGEGAKNFVQHGFLDSGLMPTRYRVELADGSLVREWYAHHPAFFVLVSAVSLASFGDHEWAIRLPWLCFSLAAVWAAWRFFATLWDERVALVGALFLALLPLAAHYAILPWVDSNAVPWAYALFLRRYVLWQRGPTRAALRRCALWAFLGTMLDWNMVFVLVLALLHALCTSLLSREAGAGPPPGERLRRVLPLLWVPAAAGAAVALHGLHMLLVMTRAEVFADTTETLERATSNADSLGVFLRNQAWNLERTLTWPYLALLVLALGEPLWRAARGRLTRAETLLPVLLLPGLLYVSAFPFRGTNHDFMWALSLLGFAAAPALLVTRLAAGAASPGRRLLALALALGALALCPWRTLELWRANRSDAVARLAQQDWFRRTFSDPRAVAVTSTGQTWMMLYYASTPIVPRVMGVPQLEELRRRVLARLGPERKVWFVFDLQLATVQGELYAYLQRSGPSERHLELLGADPTLAFELFDLTAWAGS